MIDKEKSDFRFSARKNNPKILEYPKLNLKISKFSYTLK